MATQKGLIKFGGTLDGVTFYFYKGKPVARRAGGGFTSKALKTGTNMERARETNSEFGHCSRVKKVFKDALFPFFGKCHDGTLHARMMRLFLDIRDCDGVSNRGKRSVAQGLLTTEGKKLLQQFAFTEMVVPFARTVYDVSTHELTVGLLPPEQLSFVNGATHMEVCFGVLAFDFDALTATLYPSEVLRIAKGAITPDFTLVPTETPTAPGMRFAVVTYHNVQDVNGVFYPFKEGKSFGVRVLEVG